MEDLDNFYINIAIYKIYKITTLRLPRHLSYCQKDADQSTSIVDTIKILSRLGQCLTNFNELRLVYLFQRLAWYTYF